MMWYIPQCRNIHVSGTMLRIRVVPVKRIHLVNKYLLTKYLHPLHDRKPWPQDTETWKISSGVVWGDLESSWVQQTPAVST